MSEISMQKYRPGRIKYVFLVLLGLLYIILGIYIFWSRKQITVSPWGEITACLFILYGSWRTYRAIQSQSSYIKDEE